jgi:hypothetical protein
MIALNLDTPYFTEPPTPQRFLSSAASSFSLTSWTGTPDTVVTAFAAAARDLAPDPDAIAIAPPLPQPRVTPLAQIAIDRRAHHPEVRLHGLHGIA